MSTALPQPAWFDSYLRPSPVNLRGTVVDSNNKPLAGVTISGVEKDGDFALSVDLTDDGKFDITTRSPSLVFRKDGFKSTFVRVSGSENQRIVLEPHSAVPLPDCRPNIHCEDGDVFCMRELHNLRRRKQTGPVIDASVDTYVPLEQPDPLAILTHGGGASWLGEPRLRQIWSSVQYAERRKQAHRLTVIDARGRTASGKLWRNIGVDYQTRSGGEPYHVAESLFYEDRTPKEAALFDGVLDSLCVNPAAPN